MSKISEAPVVIVTGAGGDIGLETIRCLQRDGWSVFATSLQITSALASTMKSNDFAFAADLTNSAEINVLVQKAIEHFGRLDGLVNCAGASGIAKFHEQNEDEWDRYLDINLTSAFLISKAFISTCLNLPSADRSMVLISSLAALAGGANPAYGAAKAGVCTMVYNMAQTYGVDRIRANAVLPGIIDTQMVRNAFPDEKYEKLKAAASARTPLGRLGTANEVAELCAFLMSERASFITGSVVNITGGFELTPPIGKI